MYVNSLEMGTRIGIWLEGLLIGRCSWVRVGCTRRWVAEESRRMLRSEIDIASVQRDGWSSSVDEYQGCERVTPNLEQWKLGAVGRS